MIDKDLARLYPEHGDFFQSSPCQTALRRILLVWSLKNPQPGYCQGMHELLAPLVYVLHADAVRLWKLRGQFEDLLGDRFDKTVGFGDAGGYASAHTNPCWACGGASWGDKRDRIVEERSDRDAAEEDWSIIEMLAEASDPYGAEGELGAVLSGRFIEHDAFLMFESLMNGEGGRGAVAVMDYFIVPPADSGVVPPILQACGGIYHTLAAADPVLYNHMIALKVEPQLFALRWLRLLFGREFGLEDLLIIWDAFFSASNIPRAKKDSSAGGEASNDEELLDGERGCTCLHASERGDLILSMAVSMLLYVRHTLLGAADAGGCLRRLLDFPKVGDITALIGSAEVLQQIAEVVASDGQPSTPWVLADSGTRKSWPHKAKGNGSAGAAGVGGGAKAGGGKGLVGAGGSQSNVAEWSRQVGMVTGAVLRRHRLSNSSDVNVPDLNSYWEEKWTNLVMQSLADEQEWVGRLGWEWVGWPMGLLQGTIDVPDGRGEGEGKGKDLIAAQIKMLLQKAMSRSGRDSESVGPTHSRESESEGVGDVSSSDDSSSDQALKGVTDFAGRSMEEGLTSAAEIRACSEQRKDVGLGAEEHEIGRRDASKGSVPWYRMTKSVSEDGSGVREASMAEGSAREVAVQREQAGREQEGDGTAKAADAESQLLGIQGDTHMDRKTMEGTGDLRQPLIGSDGKWLARNGSFGEKVDDDESQDGRQTLEHEASAVSVDTGLAALETKRGWHERRWSLGSGVTVGAKDPVRQPVALKTYWTMMSTLPDKTGNHGRMDVEGGVSGRQGASLRGLLVCDEAVCSSEKSVDGDVDDLGFGLDGDGSCFFRDMTESEGAKHLLERRVGGGEGDVKDKSSVDVCESDWEAHSVVDACEVVGGSVISYTEHVDHGVEGSGVDSNAASCLRRRHAGGCRDWNVRAKGTAGSGGEIREIGDGFRGGAGPHAGRLKAVGDARRHNNCAIHLASAGVQDLAPVAVRGISKVRKKHKGDLGRHRGKAGVKRRASHALEVSFDSPRSDRSCVDGVADMDMEGCDREGREAGWTEFVKCGVHSGMGGSKGVIENLNSIRGNGLHDGDDCALETKGERVEGLHLDEELDMEPVLKGCDSSLEGIAGQGDFKARCMMLSRGMIEPIQVLEAALLGGMSARLTTRDLNHRVLSEVRVADSSSSEEDPNCLSSLVKPADLEGKAVVDGCRFQQSVAAGEGEAVPCDINAEKIEKRNISRMGTDDHRERSDHRSLAAKDIAGTRMDRKQQQEGEQEALVMCVDVIGALAQLKRIQEELCIISGVCPSDEVAEGTELQENVREASGRGSCVSDA
ncbi:hypothetical protein CBR_g48913 [Chara braunii]|uniref:Rab-GAP TBC domain-containing protein n=1 Tax=Chara braunii TaxID=69332 RepID=A0A388M3Y4_CHABU|nr:hypothetical protein CBR_g48913 [Chara braunii]|eukprot:GBG89205.1 hypothetical protein CBR_g48913 [Chara braunii]